MSHNNCPRFDIRYDICHSYEFRSARVCQRTGALDTSLSHSAGNYNLLTFHLSQYSFDCTRTTVTVNNCTQPFCSKDTKPNSDFDVKCEGIHVILLHCYRREKPHQLSSTYHVIPTSNRVVWDMNEQCGFSNNNQQLSTRLLVGSCYRTSRYGTSSVYKPSGR